MPQSWQTGCTTHTRTHTHTLTQVHAHAHTPPPLSSAYILPTQLWTGGLPGKVQLSQAAGTGPELRVLSLPRDEYGQPQGRRSLLPLANLWLPSVFSQMFAVRQGKVNTRREARGSRERTNTPVARSPVPSPEACPLIQRHFQPHEPACSLGANRSVLTAPPSFQANSSHLPPILSLPHLKKCLPFSVLIRIALKRRESILFPTSFHLGNDSGARGDCTAPEALELGNVSQNSEDDRKGSR